MKQISSYAFCLLLFILQGCYGEKFILTETNKESLSSGMENIFLIGVGSNQVRVFLEPVADKMIKVFEAKKIHAAYSYAGKTKEEVSKCIAGIHPAKEDVVFIIVPRNDYSLVPYTYVSNDYYPTGTGGFTGKSVVQGAWLNDEFFLSMYETKKQKDPFWSATMMIKCEVGSNRTIDKVAGLIISALERNHYLPSR